MNATARQLFVVCRAIPLAMARALPSPIPAETIANRMLIASVGSQETYSRGIGTRTSLFPEREEQTRRLPESAEQESSHGGPAVRRRACQSGRGARTADAPFL